MNGEIKQITAEEARQIIDKRKPLGLFWHVGDYSFVGIDNRDGNAWTEEFTDFDMLTEWLNGAELEDEAEEI